MKRNNIIILLSLICCQVSFAQSAVPEKTDTAQQIATYLNTRMNELFEAGVEAKNDSLIIRAEVFRLLKDSQYRQSAYPEKYEWAEAIRLMKAMELKRAFWYFINMYHSLPASRDLIITTVVMYDSIMPMDKVILNSFYTYSFADPQLCRIKDNKPDIYRPDLMQELLAATNEIVNNILFYRKQKGRVN